MLTLMESLTFLNRKIDVFCFNFVVSYLLLLLLCITVCLVVKVPGREELVLGGISQVSPPCTTFLFLVGR